MISKTTFGYGLALLPWFVLGGTTGCGSGDAAAPPPPNTGDDGGRGILVGLRPTPRVRAPDAGDGGAIDGAARDGGDAAVRTEAAAPGCTPEAGPDEPDDDFADTNCDGIDGDASRAVFVAPTGSDTAAGTMDAPVQTIGKAVALAGERAKSVYVCNGEYKENVRIETRAVSIYGGYDCSNAWKRVPDRAHIDPAMGVPLVVANVGDSMRIERLAIRAEDASSKDYGSSSVAVSVLRSKDVLFRRTIVRSGDGAPGANGGAAVSAWTGDQAAAAAGVIVTSDCHLPQNVGGNQSPQSCFTVARGGSGTGRVCPDGSHGLGGFGGDGGNVALNLLPAPGRSGTPFLGAYVAGRDGAPGADGQSGTGAGQGFGRIDTGAYVASNSGAPAAPGQIGEAGIGGNGGQSLSRGDIVVTFWVGGGGGQGGYPGCGGAAGNPGGGGGASIAIISDSSGLRLEDSELETGRGGDGGNGSEGAPGQKGGPGAAGGTVPDGAQQNGQPGGKGGDGGHGGAGGPGGGGPSIGIAWTKQAPITGATTIVIGTAGRGGVTSARIAADGVVAETYPPVGNGDGGQGGSP